MRPDATPALQSLEFVDMYAYSDDFYQSLGHLPMTRRFWANSVFEKSKSGDMVSRIISPLSQKNVRILYNNKINFVL